MEQFASPLKRHYKTLRAFGTGQYAGATHDYMPESAENSTLTTSVTSTPQHGQRAGGVGRYCGVRALIAAAPKTWSVAQSQQKA